MNHPIRVSVIVVNWKVRELLRTCLSTLLADTRLPAHEWELFVVDNDSGDGSVEMVAAEFPQAQLIANRDNLGFGAANNQAFERARGEYLLLLNPDTEVAGSVVERMLQWMEQRPRAAVLGARLVYPDGSLQRWTAGAFLGVGNALTHYLFLDRLLPRWARPASLYLERDETVDMDVDWVCGACMLVRREALDQVSPGMLFDPRFFMYGEDMELCHRLHRGGWSIGYTPGVTVVHHHGASLRQQDGETMLAALKGPRKFFVISQGRRWLPLIDGIAVAGFGLRYVLFQLAALLSPGRYAAKARSSRQYLGLALRVWRTA